MHVVLPCVDLRAFDEKLPTHLRSYPSNYIGYGAISQIQRRHTNAIEGDWGKLKPGVQIFRTGVFGCGNLTHHGVFIGGMAYKTRMVRFVVPRVRFDLTGAMVELDVQTGDDGFVLTPRQGFGALEVKMRRVDHASSQYCYHDGSNEQVLEALVKVVGSPSGRSCEAIHNYGKREFPGKDMDGALQRVHDFVRSPDNIVLEFTFHRTSAVEAKVCGDEIETVNRVGGESRGDVMEMSSHPCGKPRLVWIQRTSFETFCEGAGSTGSILCPDGCMSSPAKKPSVYVRLYDGHSGTTREESYTRALANEDRIIFPYGPFRNCETIARACAEDGLSSDRDWVGGKSPQGVKCLRITFLLVVVVVVSTYVLLREPRLYPLVVAIFIFVSAAAAALLERFHLARQESPKSRSFSDFKLIG